MRALALFSLMSIATSACVAAAEPEREVTMSLTTEREDAVVSAVLHDDGSSRLVVRSRISSEELSLALSAAGVGVAEWSDGSRRAVRFGGRDGLAPEDRLAGLAEALYLVWSEAAPDSGAAEAAVGALLEPGCGWLDTDDVTADCFACITCEVKGDWEICSGECLS